MRRTITLNGKWNFRIDPLDVGIKNGWFKTRFADNRWWRVQVPGAWDSYHPDLRSYDGIGWFRREFTVRGGRPAVALLRFAGAGHSASVWLNGHPLGTHEGSYCPFEFRPGLALKTGKNVLSVRVRNTLTPSSLPKLGSDWFKFGGITRPVELVLNPGPVINRVTALTSGQNGSATVSIPGRVLNPGRARQVWVEASVHGKSGGPVLACSARSLLSLPACLESPFSIAIPAQNLPRWDPDNPRLLTLAVTLRGTGGQLVDATSLRFGVRTLSWGKGKLLLNGKPVCLRGVNRMDEHPGWTSTFTRKSLGPILSDIQGGLHGNFLRAAHYPHHPLVPEMCDERGIMMLAEIPEYQNGEEPHSTPAGKTMLEELFWRDAHHPCVITWSVGNEREPRKPAIARGIRSLIGHIKALDPTRPATCVSNTFPDDPTLKDCDILCLNEYFGFWRGTTALTVGGLKRTRRELSSALDDMHRRLPGKPIVITEFGVQAYPFHDGHYGSEEWQASLVDTHIRVFMAKPFVQGCAVWAHQDTRLAGNQIYPSNQLGTRYLENFGLLTLNGRRRPSWHAVEKLYRKWMK